VHRSRVTIDLGAIRHNARALADAIGPSELWAVVKADGYGHGALDVARAALAGGARALCVVTVGEAIPLRDVHPDVRIVVLGPTEPDDVPLARDARLELATANGRLPEDIPLHLELDTGMGRWGLGELGAPGRSVVGLMTHFATADSDAAFVSEQLERFLRATDPYADRTTRHAANSAAALTEPATRLDACRCGIALYGVDPLGDDAGRFGLRPALRWESYVARVHLLRRGESTGYGRRYVATEDTWIGIVPVGYADGFRRDMTGTEVLVGGERVPVVGTVSMDALAVRLPRRAGAGQDVTLVGDGVTLEQHARVADTIGYELACGISTATGRSERVVVDG
jgi:alanine racemase